MSQSLSSVYLHAVFSTKARRPWLQDVGLREDVHSYIGGISKNLGCPPQRIGGVADHVHILARFGREITQADWIKELKRSSSAWIKDQRGAPSDFAWQAGYGAFGIEAANIDRVTKYIVNQEEHHRRISFMDEFRSLLREYNIEWDEQYVWY